jgi:hypothetical protein
MAGMPSDGRFVTGTVPPEMREGVELIEGVEVAAPTHRTAMGPDGVTEHIEQIRLPRPAHIPPGPPKLDASESEIILPRSRLIGTLRYDFPLFPGVQVSVSFSGDATADHLEQLVELLSAQCSKLRQQEQRRALEAIEAARNQPARRVKSKNVTTTKGRKDTQAPAEGDA